MNSIDTSHSVATGSNEARVRELLGTPRVVAVVGMSPKPDRASNYVALYLRENGFTTIPVNPMVSEVDGIPSYKDLASIPKDTTIDVAALFVAPERTMAAVEQAATIGLRVVWFQPGAEHRPSVERARALGLEVFEGLCMKAEHTRLFGGGK